VTPDVIKIITGAPVDPLRVDIVLVRPARAANVAATCRAMKNMALRSLRLVEPVPDLSAAEARALAYGAWDVLDGAARFPSLAAAVADCTFVAATSSRPRADASTPREVAERAGSLAAGGRAALVFGPEASGLTNDELALCEVTVRIPSNAQHPSLNLAQAVLILAYEVFLSSGGAAEPSPIGRAAAGEVEAALSELARALRAIGYLNPQNPSAALAELGSLFRRAAPTPREVALLRGVARQVLWAAARVAPPEVGADNGRPPEGT
jgi:TrmH family RNA methyltransferase